MSSKSSTCSVIDKIDKGLAKYYQSLKRKDYFDQQKKGLFRRCCDENGIEDAVIEEELKVETPEDLQDLMCLQLLEYMQPPATFPFLRPMTRGKERSVVFSILKEIYETGSPPRIIKRIDEFELEVTNEDINTARKRYESQVLSKWSKDTSLMEFFAIGLRNEDAMFLNNVVNTFMRDRIMAANHKKNATNLHQDDWVQNNAFLKTLRRSNETKAAAFKSAINNYLLLVAPHFSFTQNYIIQDHIQQIAQYLLIMTQFIQCLLCVENTKPPFMIDFMIAVKEAIVFDDGDELPDLGSDDDEEDDDDDDDEDEEDETEQDDEKQKSSNIDNIGDVEGTLKHEKCMFVASDVDQRKLNESSVILDVLSKCYKHFKQKRKCHQEYPSGQRLNMLIDRRKSEHQDRLLVFEPPTNCKRIPENHVAEWYFAASRRCLIPGKGYNAGKGNKENSIHSRSTLHGQLLTFSFHVEARNEIKCYLYYEGQVTRFYGMDVYQVLPSLFNMEWEKNEEFLRNQRAKHLAKQIEIKDVHFEKFYRSMGNDKNFPNIHKKG